MSSSHPSPASPLGIAGYTFGDLHDPQRLESLYARFCEEVQHADAELWREWDAYRREPDAHRSPLALSNLLVTMAPHVSRFITRLFHVEADADRISEATRAQDDLFRFKVDFVRRRVLPMVKGSAHLSSSADDDAVVERLIAPDLDLELAIARAGCALLDREKAGETPTADVDALKRWCAARLHDRAYRGWVVFRFPETLDYWHLVDVQRPEPDLPESMVGPDWRLRRRDGFRLTDARMNGRETLSEIHYCVLCHERDKDSCSKGLRESSGTKIAVNPLGIELEGCPLDEKISEMHALRKTGDAIGALALVIVDNPMCPGTGHRICNDCMKSCIYQKQEPVNIPQIETGVLTDVLAMPWGVEIYGLLTRWNPLNVKRPYALPYNGKNVLVVGLGPAGYTLAHYLLNEGFGVVAIDGLKIEPARREKRDVGRVLSDPPSGVLQPIRNWTDIYRDLDARVLEGFGGVSEYGITVRWDKNFLTLIHLTLARRQTLRMYGGVRFGGTLTLDDAWAHGFDHVAVATGAGKPTVIDLKNNLIRGIRKASDFLMALQLTGAFKREALANLQMRLPAIVIGGGLTAIDTATELMAYYPLQVEKTLAQYDTIAAAVGETALRARFDPEELDILDEFRAHGAAVRRERTRAADAGEAPDFISLMREWGGVTIAYRKRMVDSPAYRLNHEEVIKALEEGIAFAENLSPVEAIPDGCGALAAMVFRREGQEGQVVGRVLSDPASVTLKAKTVLVAAGTSPNITCEKESPRTFALDAKGKFFQPHRTERQADGRFTLVPDAKGFFTSHARDGRFVTYYGDNHPRYAGNVVKAMASAKHGYPRIVELFADTLAHLDPAQQSQRDRAWDALVGRMNDELTARVEDVVRLTPTIVEVIVRAPAAARRFHPGQFYRLQNYESLARRARANGHDVPLLMEGVALTGAWVDKSRGVLSLIALELGVSSRLCAYLEKGEEVVVMGPTGAPTEIPEGQNVLLLGGGLGNAVLFSIAKAMRDAGNTVVYFAGYRKGEDVFKREDIEASTDQVIWSTDTGDAITPSRPQDAHFRGNIVQALAAYQAGQIIRPAVPLGDVDRLIAIGSDRMMAAVKIARQTGVLANHFKGSHSAIASINSPMQCMMKEVCAQCLQKHVDPATGRETFIFSCFNQDQDMDRVDFPNLAARLRQNTVQEKLASAWLDRLLASTPFAHV